MDPLSQGILGASAAQSTAKKDTLKIAAFCGILGGMAPDLDIFIRSTTDPLLFIEYHRHFTHSLAFIPFGGFLVAAFLWLLVFRKKEKFLPIYLFTTIGYATHGLLDGCTSYGTRLLWPFSDYRVTWNVVSIIDPIFTTTLVTFTILCLVRKAVILARVGLCLALLYLGYGYYNQSKVHSFIELLASQRGHSIERIFLNPTIGNNMLWRSVYQSGDTYYIDAVHVSPFSELLHQEGKKVGVIDKETIFPELGNDSVQRKDIRRFSYFSKDFIYLHPDLPNVIADLRYGTLPYDDHSLWGIRIDPSSPESHVAFGNLRTIKDKHYDEFWLMLQGKFENSDNQH